MTRFAIVLALLFAALLSAADPAPAPAPISLWRPTVAAGSWSYSFDYDGRLIGDWTLEREGQRVKLARSVVGWPDQWWDHHFHGKVAIPADTKPGTYSLRCGSAPVAAIEVVAPTPARPLVVLSPGVLPDDSPRIAAALAGNDVVLNPGTYRLATPLTVRGTLSGFGATLVRVPDGRTYRDAMLTPTPGCTIEGVTLRPSQWAFGGNQAVPVGNVTVRDCTFAGGSFGRWGECPGLLVERCRFDRAGASPVTGGLWLDCRFEGFAPEHSWLCEGANGPTAVMGCSFRDTDRGLNVRNGWGPVRDLLVCGVEFSGINKVPNGCEILNFEGLPGRPGVERALFFHLKASNCDGQILGYNCPVRDARFWDIVLAGGAGIELRGQDGAVQERCEFVDCELVGGVFSFGPTARDCKLSRCYVGGPPSRDNQGWVDTSPAGRLRAARTAFTARGPGIVAEGCWTDLPRVATGVTWR